MYRATLFACLALLLVSFFDCVSPSHSLETSPEPQVSKETIHQSEIVQDTANTEPVKPEPASDEPISDVPVSDEPVSDEPVSDEPFRNESVPDTASEPYDAGTKESSREALPERQPETPIDQSGCPSGTSRITLPGSYEIDKKLNVSRCVHDPTPGRCTSLHSGSPQAQKFVVVGCGFDPTRDRNRFNVLSARIKEAYFRTEPYKRLKASFTLIRNDDLQTGFDLTHKTRYCSEAWILAQGEGANAVPNWAATTGLWYNARLLQAGNRCGANIVIVLANNSGWAGGAHNEWRGWMSIVGSGVDDRAVRRQRAVNESICKQWVAVYPGKCQWKGICFCDENIPETAPPLPPAPKKHPNCTSQTPQHCPWPYIHPDHFIEYTALHEVGHTFAGFAHPSSGTIAQPVDPKKVPNNCYFPPANTSPDAKLPCPGWQANDHTLWVLPQDAQGKEPKQFGCYKGCADNLNLYAPWRGTQMMIRDDDLHYGFSPVERKILADRLNQPCWVIGQKNPSQPTQTCQAGPLFDLRHGTGLVFR